MAPEVTQPVSAKAKIKSWSSAENQGDEVAGTKGTHVRLFRTWNAHCSVGGITGYWSGRPGALQARDSLIHLPPQNPDTVRSLG